MFQKARHGALTAAVRAVLLGDTSEIEECGSVRAPCFSAGRTSRAAARSAVLKTFSPLPAVADHSAALRVIGARVEGAVDDAQIRVVEPVEQGDDGVEFLDQVVLLGLRPDGARLDPDCGGPLAEARVVRLGSGEAAGDVDDAGAEPDAGGAGVRVVEFGTWSSTTRRANQSSTIEDRTPSRYASSPSVPPGQRTYGA